MQKRHPDAQSEARKRMRAAGLAVRRISDVVDEVDRLTSVLARMRGAANAAAAEGEPDEYADLLSHIRVVVATADGLAESVNAHTRRLEAEGRRATDAVIAEFEATLVVPSTVAPEDVTPPWMRAAIERYEAEKRTAAAEEERKRESARRDDMAIYNARLYDARGRVKAGVASECEKAMVANEDGVAAVYGAEKSDNE